MISQFAGEMRKLVYTIVCFQCLLQLTSGMAYQKYLKLFSELIILCICCSVILNFFGFLDKSFNETDALYKKWTREWERISQEQNIYDNSSYLENKILDEAFKLYENEKGAEHNATKLKTTAE